MPYILCVYYSRTGNTEKLMREIAAGGPRAQVVAAGDHRDAVPGVNAALRQERQ